MLAERACALLILRPPLVIHDLRGSRGTSLGMLAASVYPLRRPHLVTLRAPRVQCLTFKMAAVPRSSERPNLLLRVLAVRFYPWRGPHLVTLRRPACSA